MTLEQIAEIAKRRGSVRWRDGTTTPLSIEDSHLFGMVLVKWVDGEAEPLPVANEYDAESAQTENPR